MIISYFARHPIASNLILLAVSMLGLSVLTSMKRESFPEFVASEVSVSVTFTGASAADVDEQICVVLDDALGAVSNLDDLECLSVDNRATAMLTLKEGGDIGQFYNDISSEVSSIRNLPDAADPPAVAILGQTEPIVFIAISGLDSTGALMRYADFLAEEFAALPNIATASISGISEPQFRITFDQLSLRRFGLCPADAANSVAARSLRAPLGTVSTVGQDLTLRYFDARRSVDELENLVLLENADGGIVRLADVAQVTLGESDPDLRAFVDGDRAAIIRVNKTKDDDAIDAFKQVEARMGIEQAKYPTPFRLTVINNTTENVAEQINLVLSNAAISLVLVMCLFFSLSEAIWISLALPFSFLGGLFAMSLLGVTINIMSLIALLMAIGLIMDDSIVIADNIAKWWHKLGPKDAAIRGASEVMPGVVSSFLTTTCVFGPLMFLSGETGQILKVIPVVLVLTMMASLIEAFIILPNHMSHSTADPDTNAARLVPRMLVQLRDGFVIPVTAALMRWRYAILGTVFAIFIFSISMIGLGLVKVVGFPEIEGDTIEVRLAQSSGLQIDRTEAVVNQLLAGLGSVENDLTPNTKNQQPLVERVLVSYGSNFDVKDNGAHSATIIVDLLTSDARNVAADDVLAAWRVAAGPIPDLVQINFTQMAARPGGSDLDVELSSRDCPA